MAVSSIKGFFGKFKAALKGESKATTSQVSYQQAIGRSKRKAAPTAHGRKHTTGAFGGTGTGRGRRGMPGRKLAKKMVKAGWNAQKRVMPGVPCAHPASVLGGKRQRKRLERIGLSAGWKAKNAARKSACMAVFGEKHAPKGGFDKNFHGQKAVSK